MRMTFFSTTVCHAVNWDSGCHPSESTITFFGATDSDVSL